MIREEFQDLDALREKYDPRIINKALNSAINKTKNKTRTIVSRGVRNIYNIKASKLKAALKEIAIQPNKGNVNDVVIERVLSYTGGRISLINFDAKSKTVRVSMKGRKKKVTRNAVTVRVKKSSGRKLVKGKDGRGAFIGVGNNSNEHVFMRSSDKRLPIEKLWGLSVPEMVNTTKVLDEVDDFVKSELPDQLDHALDYFLGKAGAL